MDPHQYEREVWYLYSEKPSKNEVPRRTQGRRLKLFLFLTKGNTFPH